MTFRAGVVLVGLLAAGALPLSAQTFRVGAGLAELREYARTDSNEATAHYLVGLALWDADDWRAADTAFRLAVAIDPRFPEAYLALSYLIIERPQLITGGRAEVPWSVAAGEAVRLGRRARLINPLVTLPVGSFPKKLFPDPLVLGRPDLVYAAMDEAARQFKERKYPERVPSEVLYLRGMSAAHLQRHPIAIRDIGALLERSVKLDTSTTLEAAPMRTNELRYILGVLHHRAGQLDRAKELYRAAAETDLGLYMAHVQLAGILVEQGKLDSAIIARRAAVDVNPDDSSVHVDLALTLLQAKRDAAAATELQIAAELNPRDARVQYLLGVLAQTAGMLDEAKTHLGRFVAMAPSRMADEVTDARARLAKLP